MTALVAAIPIEVLNARLADAMFDPGPAPTDWGSILLAYEWGILHLPGLLLARLLHWYGPTWPWLLFGSGYLDTALLLVAIILVLGRLQRYLARIIHRPGRHITHRSAG